MTWSRGGDQTVQLNAWREGIMVSRYLFAQRPSHSWEWKGRDGKESKEKKMGVSGKAGLKALLCQPSIQNHVAHNSCSTSAQTQVY